MGLTPAQDYVLDWMGGVAQPRSLRYIVLGVQKEVPTYFNRFVCLYPDKPRIRRFTVELPEALQHLAIPPDGVRSMLRSCVLPDDAEERYHAYLRSAFPTLDDQKARKLGVDRARNAGLPIGVYALGLTAIRQDLRAILVVNALVSPTLFLKDLKRTRG